MILLGVLTWLIPIFINIYLDRNGDKRDYLQVNTIRGIVLIVHAAFFFNIQGGNFYWEDMKRNIPIFTYYFTSYWIFFDLGLNIIRKRISQNGLFKGLFYFDQKEGDSGWIEKLFKNSFTGYVILKVIALIFMVLSIIAIFYNK